MPIAKCYELMMKRGRRRFTVAKVLTLPETGVGKKELLHVKDVEANNGQ